MKFLIAGFGSIGRRHFRNLLALEQNDIIFYRTQHSTLPEDELKDFTIETDLQAALAHQPDAAIIANPTAYHLEVAIPCAQAGCHVLVEKPVSQDTRRLDDLQKAMQLTQVKVLVGYQFRFHPTLNSLKSILESEEFGKPLFARAHWGEYLPGWHPWEDYRKSYSARKELGGGVVLTLSHPLDYLHWLFGDVHMVSAFTRHASQLEIDVEDIAEISLKFESGMLASAHLDYLQQPAEHSLEMITTTSTIRWNNDDGVLQLIKPQDQRLISPPEGFERNDLFLAEMRHFIDIIRNEVEPICSLEDGIVALRLAMAANESADSGKVIQFV
jgi:predicted dehydrogenase